MNEREQWCFDNLREPCVEPKFIQESHGIDWPPDDQFQRDFALWLTDNQPKPCPAATVSRHDFEWFLQSGRLLPRKEAAARLGMAEGSLEELLLVLPGLGLPKKYEVYPGIIDQSLSEDLVRRLSGLRFRTFSDHNSFCELLHKSLLAAASLQIKPLFCATSRLMNDYPRLYANTWDSITLLPLSGRHQVWLDFRKPLALAPDRCSKLFFAENRDAMLPFIAGRGEPHDIDAYTTFLEAAR